MLVNETDFEDLFNEDLNYEEKNQIILLLSDKVINNSIKEQTNETIIEDFSSVNYIDVFNTRFDYLLEKYENNYDLIRDFKAIKQDFFESLLKNIEDKFSIVSNINTSNMSYTDFYDYVKSLYEFFVIDYKNKLTVFINEYIKYNKNGFINIYKDKTDRQDISISSVKKNLKENDDLVILYNLDNIVGDIVATVKSSEFILETIINEDQYEINNFLLAKLINETDFSLDVDFSEKFFLPLVDENYKSEIIVELYNDLFEASPKKK